MDVVLPREADGLVHGVGMAEGEIDGVVRAERRAQRGHLRGRAGPVPDPRDDFPIDVAVVLVVPRQPLGGMTRAGVEALLVDAVHAGDLDRPSLDEIADRADQPEVFVLEEVSERSRVPDHRTTRIAVPEQVHPAAEARRIPGDVLAIHLVSDLCAADRQGSTAWDNSSSPGRSAAVAYLLWEQMVAGSIPAAPTSRSLRFLCFPPVTPRHAFRSSRSPGETMRRF